MFMFDMLTTHFNVPFQNVKYIMFLRFYQKF